MPRKASSPKRKKRALPDALKKHQFKKRAAGGAPDDMTSPTGCNTCDAVRAQAKTLDEKIAEWIGDL